MSIRSSCGCGSSVGKAPWVKVPKKRCNWADVSLIPGHGLGVREKSILATPSVAVWGETYLRRNKCVVWAGSKKMSIRSKVGAPKLWRQTSRNILFRRGTNFRPKINRPKMLIFLSANESVIISRNGSCIKDFFVSSWHLLYGILVQNPKNYMLLESAHWDLQNAVTI